MIESSLYKLDLFNNGPVVIFIWKNESGWPVESITNNILDIYGHDSKQYLSGELKYMDQIHPDDLPRVSKEVVAASNNIESNSFVHQPYRYLDGFGKYRWVKDSSQIIRSENGDITHFIGYLVDVTIETKLQEESNRLKERLDLAWTGTGDGLWDWDIERNIVYFSPRWKEMLGFHQDEFPNEVSAFFEIIHFEDKPLVEDLLNHHFSNPENIPYEIDVRLCCKNGEYKWIKIRGKATLSSEGIPLRMTGAHTDISKEVELLQEIKNQKQLYQNLMQFAKEKEELLETLLNSITEGVYGFDDSGKCIFVNQKFLQLLGYDHEDEILGKNIHRLIHHTKKDGFECSEDQCMIYKANRIYESCHAKNEIFWKRDGTSIEVDYWSSPIHNEHYNGSVVTFLDVTTKNRLKRERKLQEEQMLQQSRLAQMGEMISMIAHQWRQPLMAISIAVINMKLDAQLENFDLKTKDGRDAQKNAYLDELNNIEGYIENLTTTIDDFRNFYKPDKKLVLCSFHEISAKALNIIQKSLDMAGITIVEEYFDEMKIEMHENEVIQVVLNIFKNAQDNFKEKKTVKPQIKITSKNNILDISDNGGGIPDSIIEKIFDPYFSTKDEKNGTGLGLYMSKMIVEEHHNGILKAENKNGGVLFKIILGSDLNF